MESWFSLDRNAKSDGTETMQDSERLSLLALAGDSSSSARLPDGFRSVETAPGVEVLSNGTDYVISLDLKAGGFLKLLAGDYSHSGSRKSGYGGVTPELARMSASEAMKRSTDTMPGSRCVVNGSFFANFERATAEIAFPLKSGGKIVSDGFAPLDRHRGKKLTLMIYSDGARIVPFKESDIDSFRQNGAQDSVVSLSSEVNVDSKQDARIGRTYLGLADRQSNGLYRKAHLFVSPASSQSHARKILEAFGAGPVMQFDGGGSSQLQCGPRAYVRSPRTVPQFLVIGSE